MEMYLQELCHPIANIDYISLPDMIKSTQDTLNLLTFYKASYSLPILKNCFSILIKIYWTISSYSSIT